MECNIGNTEKIIRLILGLAFVWLGYTMSPWWYLVAAILIATATVSFCPLNKVLGINTCKPKEERSEEPSTPKEEEMEPQKEQTEPEQRMEENE